MANSFSTSPAITAMPSGGPKPPLDFSYHFSRVTKAREESKIKEFYKYFMIPGIGNLAGGKWELNRSLRSSVSFSFRPDSLGLGHI